jgi:ribonuclease P protein component
MARLGLAISRRQAPSAVERNRIKRLVRECFRQRPWDRIPFDLVVMLRAPTRGVTTAELRQELARLWEPLGIAAPLSQPNRA